MRERDREREVAGGSRALLRERDGREKERLRERGMEGRKGRNRPKEERKACFFSL